MHGRTAVCTAHNGHTKVGRMNIPGHRAGEKHRLWEGSKG